MAGNAFDAARGSERDVARKGLPPEGPENLCRKIFGSPGDGAAARRSEGLAGTRIAAACRAPAGWAARPSAKPTRPPIGTADDRPDRTCSRPLRPGTRRPGRPPPNRRANKAAGARQGTGDSAGRARPFLPSPAGRMAGGHSRVSLRLDSISSKAKKAPRFIPAQRAAARAQAWGSRRLICQNGQVRHWVGRTG